MTSSQLLTYNTKRENWYDLSLTPDSALRDNQGPVIVSRCHGRDRGPWHIACLDLAIVVSLNEDSLRVCSLPHTSLSKGDLEECLAAARIADRSDTDVNAFTWLCVVRDGDSHCPIALGVRA